MTRRIILFLVTFLVTAGILGGVYYAISQGLIPGLALVERKDKQPEPEVVVPQPITPTVEQTTPQQPEAVEPAPAEPTPAEPEPLPVDPTLETPATTTEQPTTEPAKQEPAGEPQVAPEPETPERLILNPSEAPRNAEHKAALIAREALRSENPEEAVNYLVERGQISAEAGAALLDWGKNNKAGAIEEVGNSRRQDGARVTRFRMKSEDGQHDLLLDVVTDRTGVVTVQTATPAPADKTAIDATCDHLTVAEGFMEAVRRGDMKKACAMITGEQVSYATVAGLCMVFEEGAYGLREQAPIRNTFSNEDFAGYLVYLTSTANEKAKPANIGLELARTEPGWLVQAVALDALLSSYENSATEEGGRYFPIVKNPKGGDSLALFFAFNEADLTPRSLRQLQIVAELLKQTSGKLNISGHTDDVGSEQYNQRLSERRADAVKAALVSFGVLAEQITTHGLGKSQPRRTYSEEDSEQVVDYIRGENRRAEIYLDFE